MLTLCLFFQAPLRSDRDGALGFCGYGRITFVRCGKVRGALNWVCAGFSFTGPPKLGGRGRNESLWEREGLVSVHGWEDVRGEIACMLGITI